MATIAQYNCSVGDVVSIGESIVAEGMSFTGNGDALNSAQFYIKESATPLAGILYAKIYAISGTYGTSDIPTGSPLAISDAMSVSGITTSYAQLTFNFSGANKITLVNGTHYFVVVDAGSITSGAVMVGGITSGNTSSGSFADYIYRTSAWNHVSGYALNFGVSGATPTTTQITESAQYSIIKAPKASVTQSLEYSITTKAYTREQSASLPTDNSDLSTQYSAAEVTDVSSDDGNYVSITAADPDYGIHQYKLRMVSDTQPIRVTWIGKVSVAPSLKTVYLQIYNYNSSAWETLTSNSSASAGSDFTLTTEQSANISHYYGSYNEVTVRIYQ